jgi:hypothetical protein
MRPPASSTPATGTPTSPSRLSLPIATLSDHIESRWGRDALHLRFDELTEPAAVPRDTDYSTLFESDVPIVVQHTRLDSRHAEVSLLSTTAYSDG